MKFAIITHVPHGIDDRIFFAYGPYVREMNIWTKFTDEVTIVAPLELEKSTAIDTNYDHQNIKFQKIKSFDVKSFMAIVKTMLAIPAIIGTIYKAMRDADHIHLRCPGNIGLLGCLVQIAFPRKKKSAKYAGNWDPNSKQPLSYRIQKWILNNTFLTRNMQVLVYGEWSGTSVNIKPFFTASYHESDKFEIDPRELHQPIKFLFVGTLSPGKRPLYAVKLISELQRKGISVSLQLFGEGQQRKLIEQYVQENNFENSVELLGNRSESEVRAAYQSAHFMILPSKSEGWPKAVAEAMFWGCVPLVSNVSCVAEMIGYEKRGLLLGLESATDATAIQELSADDARYRTMAFEAREWSQRYTIERFENEIKKILEC